MKNTTRSITAFRFAFFAIFGSGSRLSLLIKTSGEVNPKVLAAVAGGGIAVGVTPDLIRLIKGRKSVHPPTKPKEVPERVPRTLDRITEHQAKTTLKKTTLTVLRTNPSSFSQSDMPELFQKYPDLSAALPNEQSLNTFLESNSRFWEDAFISLYRRNPELLAPALPGERVLTSGKKEGAPEIRTVW